jgi:hemerythrin-like domain-containing protein
MLNEKTGRRAFVGGGALISLSALLVGCEPFKSLGKSADDTSSPQVEISPTEDLLQEHGLINRIILIYDSAVALIAAKNPFDHAQIANAAEIIRDFVHNYHEKHEEDHLFPRFEKVGKELELVQTLRRQHQTANQLTNQIAQLAALQALGPHESQELSKALSKFTAMYRHHAAREDTVLFPAFRQLVTPAEFDELGQIFEDEEHRLFGENGFASQVAKIEAIEKALGIFDLNQFTA